jgi:nucleotide-binding universal stress UspA family protein
MNNEKFKILVPVDFSEESAAGLRTGLEICRITQGEILVFNVITEITSMMEHYYHDFEAISSAFRLGQKHLEGKEELVIKDIQNTIKKMGFEDIKPQIEIRVGFYKDALKEYFKHHDIDFMVMGTNGRSTLTEFFTDHHTMQSIRIAEVPVLAVKKNLLKDQMNSLLLGIELKEYKTEAVKAIRKIVEILKLKVHIVHVKQSVFEEKDVPLRKLKKFAKRHGFENCTFDVIDEGEVYKQIDKYAERMNLDIIASISQGNNAFFKLLFGSKTEELIDYSEKPILSIVE